MMSPMLSPRGGVPLNMPGQVAMQTADHHLSHHTALHSPQMTPRSQYQHSPRQGGQSQIIHVHMVNGQSHTPQMSPRTVYGVQQTNGSSWQWGGAARATPMPTFHPPPPNGISYNLSPTASPSKVSSGVHPAESFVTGRPLQREPPQQSVDVKSVMRPLFSPKMLERATNHAPASQWAASAGGSGGNGEGAEGQMKQFREVQASAEAKSSSWEAERQQLEANHRKELQRVSAGVQSLQLVIIDQRDLIEKLRKYQDHIDSIDVQYLRQELVKMTTVHEDRIEEERKVSEALRQELMRLRAAKSEPPAERTEKDGKLQELLAAALSMVEGLQSQLAERIEACADTAEAVKQERALRDAAEEACASMSRDFNHKVAEMEKLQHDKVAAVEASYAAMQAEHQAKMAALDYMTNDLAEMRRDDHGDKVRELNKRSVDDAKSLRDAREKFMELEVIIGKHQEVLDNEAQKAREAEARAREAVEDLANHQQIAQMVEDQFKHLQMVVKDLTEGDGVHKLRNVQELLAKMQAEHDEEVGILKAQLKREHDWLEEILLSSPADDEKAGEVKGDARERIVQRLRSITDREKFGRLRARIQAHVQATQGMTVQEMGGQIEGLLLAVSAAEAEADQARGKVEGLREERERLMVTLQRAEELSTELSQRCELEEHERLKRMREMLKQQKVISELYSRIAELQAEVEGFEEAASLSLKRQQIAHSTQLERVALKHRSQVARAQETIEVLKASLGGIESDEHENMLAAVELKAMQSRAQWLEDEFERKCAVCEGVMQSNVRMEKTISELENSLSAVNTDLEELKQQSLAGTGSPAENKRMSGANLYMRDAGMVTDKHSTSHHDVDAGVPLYDLAAGERIAELEGVEAALVSQITQHRLQNLRLEEEAARMRVDFRNEAGREWVPQHEAGTRSSELKTSSSSIAGVAGKSGSDLSGGSALTEERLDLHLMTHRSSLT